MPLRPPYAPRRLAALLVAALVLGLAPGADAAARAPGSPGIGDDYFPLDGNGGIDVLSYQIHDRYEFGRKRISGWTRLKVRATQDLSRFNLDFLLPVTRVEVDGRKADVRRPVRHELRITPRRPIASGDRFTVVVKYAGRPGRYAYAGERNWLASRNEVVAMNEPHMAPWWFPSNDHPQDKAKVDIRITVPRGREVIANGHRVGRKVHGRLATTRWRAREPMVPYLAFFAAGDFLVDRGRSHGHRWYVAVSQQLGERQQRRSMRQMRSSARIVRWLETQLGDYPFSITGGLVTGLPVGFALENQTRPTYPAVGGRATLLVVHELAHQWFGDSVAVQNWEDIWLNEGFATFVEVRYTQTHGGRSARTWLCSRYRQTPADSTFWDLEIGDPGKRNIFAGEVYYRGGMTLAALESRIDSADLWQLLRTWASQNAGGNGSSADFEALAEQVSGESLDAFFDAWLFTGARPPNSSANGLACA